MARLWLVFALALMGRASAQSASVLLLPSAIAYDAAGNLYIADSGRNQVLEATLAGTLLVVAGTGTQGFAGDGGAATAALLNRPQGLAVGSDGRVYVADTGNARIRVVAGGTIATLAGNGVVSFGGDGKVAVAASFRAPTALALDAGGGVLVCDTADHRIRRVGPGAGGLVSTVAGTGVQGFAGDGGLATAAELDSPGGLAVAADGRIFFSDAHNQRIREILTTGLISTYAGNGQRGGGGDGGQAILAQLASPRGLALTASGTLLVGDADNQRVRQITAAGVISTLAGAGSEGVSSDGSAAAVSALRGPRGVAISSFGMPVLVDALNGTVRVVLPAGTLFQPAALASARAASIVKTALVSAQAGTQTYGPVSATVVVTGPVGTAGGTVALSDAGTSVGSALLSGGSATISGGLLAAGAHTLRVSYGGDGLNGAAQGAASTLQVTPLAVSATADSASALYGGTQPQLTGTVGGVLPQDAAQVGVVFTSSATALSPVGSYPIAAALTGVKSANYTAVLSPASGTLQITPAPSSTILNVAAQAYAGLPLRLSAAVAPGTQGRPTGTVQFLDGGVPVAAAPVVNGSASAVDLSPAAGSHSFTAVYSGDGNFLSSTSATQAAAVGALPDFGISVGVTTTTVLAGNSASLQLLVNAQPAPFTGNVTLAIAGLPKGASATFSPVQVIPGAGSAGVTVTIQVPAPQASLRSSRPSTIAFGCVLLFAGLSLRQRRRLSIVLSLGLAMVWIAGCGARTVGEGAGALTSTSYPLQITGTSTNLAGALVTHSTTATLIVQQ